MINMNLSQLRKLNGYTQEYIAEKLGVSRQSISKWESGESVPDIEICKKLADLYNVSLDDLVNYSSEETGLSVPPKGKHIFGTVTVGERGQIVIPKKARDVFKILPGDKLLILGDEERAGLAIVKLDDMMMFFKEIGGAANFD